MLQSGFRELRRREIRRVMGRGSPVFTDEWTSADIASLYVETFARQGIQVADAEITQIDRLVELVGRGLGGVTACRTAEGNRIVGAVLCLYANGVANMILNLMARDCRGSGLGAWMVYSAIRNARAHGEHTFDFNGANSPARGDDKHSYGARPELYFDVSFEQAAT
jgi:hypothetical protein